MGRFDDLTVGDSPAGSKEAEEHPCVLWQWVEVAAELNTQMEL